MKKITLFMSTIIILLCFIFSVNAAGENAQTAVPIQLNESLVATLTEDDFEYYFKFTPSKTDYYEISLNGNDFEEVETSIRDSNGDLIAFGGWDQYTNKNLAACKLQANKTYYFELYYYGYMDISIYTTLKKHTHELKVSYISKSDQYGAGKITKECSICEDAFETAIPKVVVTSSKEKFTYNKKTQRPTITVKDTSGKVFKQGTDYTVTYPSSSVNTGVYNAIVKMDNEYYSLSEYIYYTIEPKSIKNLDISLDKTTIAYGKEPTVKISGLKEGKDFSCSSYYYGVGKHSVSICGENNYTGTATKTFKVVPPNISGLKSAKATTTSIKLSWKSDNNYVTDYYQIYDVNKKKVMKTISSENTSYTIKNLKPGKKYSFKVRGYSKSEGEKYYGEWKTIETATKPKSTSVKSAKSTKSKVLSLSWNKQSAATGYQIQYSTSSKFTTKTTETLTIKKNSQTSKTVSKLKSGKKYYVKIRTYKTIKINGKSTKVYSAWSSVKSVKVK